MYRNCFFGLVTGCLILKHDGPERTVFFFILSHGNPPRLFQHLAICVDADPVLFVPELVIFVPTVLLFQQAVNICMKPCNYFPEYPGYGGGGGYCIEVCGVGV